MVALKGKEVGIQKHPQYLQQVHHLHSHPEVLVCMEAGVGAHLDIVLAALSCGWASQMVEVEVLNFELDLE
jgi:hypothetical protein